MSDVEVIDRADIVRREVDRESNERALAVMDPAILDTMFASRDPKAIVQRIADVAEVLMDAVHQRDLARRYGDNPNEFLHIEAWQFLSSMLGMTVVGVDSRPLADGSGWEATAELRHVASGRVLGRRDAMCQKTERGREKNPPNTLRQMAQLRAARVAARSVLGFVPKIGGFEITDPDAPATKDQVGVLHQLEREIGWTHDQGHVEAGDVDSYKSLTREQASEVIDRWTALRDQAQDGGSQASSPDASRRSARPDTSDAEHSAPDTEAPGGDVDTARGHGEGPTAAPSNPPGVSTHADDTAPATAEQWARAARHGLTGAKALLQAKKRWPDADIKSKTDLTVSQMAQLIVEALA